MKKRLLSALLALALVFVLLPTTALAGETTGKEDYDISINGKGWKFERDNTSGAYIPAYYYHTNEFSADENYRKLYTNDNLMLTKEDNTVTITIRRGTSHDYRVYPIEFTLEKKSTTSGEPYDYTPCIKMGNNNNLVITGKGTLNITRDEKNGIGAALCSEVGDITITDGITVKANFLKQVSKSTVGNAISVKDHNLIISGKNTKVEARNSSCNFQDLYDVSAAVCVENGEIKVSDGATLSAINNFTNSYTSQYSYYSRAISGSSSNPCTLTVTGENSCVIAETDNSLGKAYGHVNFSIDGAKIEVGTSSPAQTITDINDISNYKYAKISVPALEKDSDVRIAGGPAVVGQWTTITANSCSGSYYYNAAKKELTLKDVNIASSSIINAIQFAAAGTYTVKLEGTNTISNVSRGILAKSANPSFTGNINVILSGSGSLDISAKGRAIEVPSGNLTFNNTGAITLATTNTANNEINAINASGKISIGNDFNRNLKITAGNDTFDLKYSDFNDLNKYKSISFATPNSTISYGGTTLKQGETIKDGKGGTATVDRENNTITLNNFKGDKALEFNAEFTPNSITLIGDSTLSAVETKYQNLTISGSGSLTAGSIKVHKEKSTSTTGNTIPNLTITGGAQVTVNRPSNEDLRAIDIDGDLTVTNGSLTATSKSDSVPTVQVGGNASFTGSTVTITNNSTTQGKSGEYSYEVSTGLYVGGTLDIKNAAKVTSTVIGGNAIYAKGDITISGDGTEVNAQNSAYKFSAISTNGTVNISDNSTVKAENLKKHQGDPTGVTDPSTGKTYNACPAITGKIANKNTQNKLHIEGFTTSNPGTSNPTDGVVLNLDINPSSAVSYILHYDVTITRGDEVARTESPVVIAGTTLLNDTYYTITDGSTVAVGTDENNYNAFYDSAKKTLKLNNAVISATQNAAIKIGEDAFATYTITVTGTNELQGNHNHCIESNSNFTINGTGTLDMTNTSSCSSAASVIHCGPGKNLTIAAEVIIKNEVKPGNLIFTVEKDAYSFATGYNVYASTDISGSPLEAYDAAKGSTYKYLRVTKENLAPTTPTPQTPFTIDGIPAQFVDGGMIATTGVTATSSNNINLPIDRVKWYTFTPVFGSDGRMDSVSDKTEATGNFEAGKYYVVEIKFVQDLSPFKSWDMKVSGWSDNDVYRQSVTARNDIEIYFLTPASAATHEHNWAENYDTVYHWKMCTYDGCTAIKDKALHVWNAWHTSNNEQQHSKSCSECSYSTPPHDIDLAYVSDGEQGHHLYCKHDGCTFVTGTTAHNYEEGSNICTDCGYNKSAPCDHTGDRAYTNNGDGTHKVTCKACGATIVEKQSHEFGPTGACIYCGATQSGGDPTPDNPGTIVIIRPAEEEKPAQQPNPSTGANDLVGLAVAAAVTAALGSAALLRKHD